jgi:hypothetical protein
VHDHQRGKTELTQAAARCNLNYSTAKVIIRDLSHRERRYVKKLIKMKENLSKRAPGDFPKLCSYREIIEKEEANKDQNESNVSTSPRTQFHIELVSRIAFDFFSRD